MYKHDALLNDLRQNVIEVTFIKEDGSERIMRCTLMPRHLPVKYLEEQEAEKKFHRENQEVIRCWDVQANGWRSFKVSSVIFCNAVDHGYM
jgi:hypothetical protein